MFIGQDSYWERKRIQYCENVDVSFHLTDIRQLSTIYNSSDVSWLKFENKTKKIKSFDGILTLSILLFLAAAGPGC